MGNMSSTDSNSLSPDFVEFMNGGGCKESFTDVVDFFKEIEDDESVKDITRLKRVFRTLEKCIEAHSDYYQPIQPLLKAKKAISEQMIEELEMKMRDEFMKRGGCKESYMAVIDCMMKNNGDDDKCEKAGSKMIKCMYAHSDYYPTLSIETLKERLLKATKDFFF